MDTGGVVPDEERNGLPSAWSMKPATLCASSSSIVPRLCLYGVPSARFACLPCWQMGPVGPRPLFLLPSTPHRGWLALSAVFVAQQ